MPVKGGKKEGDGEQQVVPHANVGTYLQEICSLRTYLDLESVTSTPVDPCHYLMVPRRQFHYQGLTTVNRGKPLAVYHDMKPPKRVGTMTRSRKNEPPHGCTSFTRHCLCESLEHGTIHTLRLQQDECKVSSLAHTLRFSVGPRPECKVSTIDQTLQICLRSDNYFRTTSTLWISEIVISPRERKSSPLLGFHFNRDPGRRTPDTLTQSLGLMGSKFRSAQTNSFDWES